MPSVISARALSLAVCNAFGDWWWCLAGERVSIFSSFLIECSTGNSSNFLQGLGFSFVFLCQKDVIIVSPKQKREKLSKDPQSSPEAWVWCPGLVPSPSPKFHGFPGLPPTDHSKLPGKMLSVRTESAGGVQCGSQAQNQSRLVGRGLI